MWVQRQRRKQKCFQSTLVSSSLTVTLATRIHSQQRFSSFAKTQSKKLSTRKGSRDVVLDLNVHKESRQSEGHVALTAQADVMEACRA